MGVVQMGLALFPSAMGTMGERLFWVNVFLGQHLLGQRLLGERPFGHAPMGKKPLGKRLLGGDDVW